MNKIILTATFICGWVMCFAQTSPFKVPLSRIDKPVTLRMDQVSADIEGYDGDEIIIEAVPGNSTKIPAAASGLKQIEIPGRAKEDDIINPKVQDDEKSLRITIPTGNFRRLLIKIPRKAYLTVEVLSYINDGKVSIKNINGLELFAIIPVIEISGVSSFMISSGGANAGRRASDKITISNVTWSAQPFILDGKPFPRRYFVGAGSASIELSIPDTVKADINYFSGNGRIFSNLNAPPTSPLIENMKSFESCFHHEPALKSIVQNGGGVKINVSNNYGNIILKKQ